jgi:hypothetical protein
MRRRRIISTARGECLVACIVVALILFVCGAAAQQNSKATVTVTPYGSPVALKIDHTGKLTLQAGSCPIPTPIGIVTIGSNVSFPDKHTLTVMKGDIGTVYDLGSQKYKISLPNDRDGKSEIDTDGPNLVVVIPNPQE